MFSGSKRHLMTQIFNSSDRPFYQSTVSMGLEPLHEEIYYDFARRFFEEKKGSFSQEMFHDVYQRFNGVTRSVKTALDVLLDKDLVFRTETGYIVYDHFFAIWLKRLY